uniref:proline-rich receptor-like protein kinase PERK3 n=1 Tax=Erigeron canadensis TaxID=72917 RepID=UPI001CB941DF|nr:proline-rich receptor-like protein kinase PERK3 [Erigeron canadensis]
MSEPIISLTGSVNNTRCLLLKQLLILCIVICVVDANVTNNGSGVRIITQPKRRLSHHGAPKTVLAPAEPPNYGPFMTSSHPLASSHLSKPSMKKSESVSPVAGFTPPQLADIAPSQSRHGSLPTGLAQPPLSPRASNCCGPESVLKRGTEGCHCVYPIKLDILLLNVSSNPNWPLFLQQFATQLGLRASQIELINFYLLGLSRLNISMDITPHTGVSFSSSEVSAINSSLSTHKVQLDPKLVGDYKLLNLTWFKPVAPAPAPRVTTPPTKAPPVKPSSTTSANTSSSGKHLSLILLICIGAGILCVAVICVLILCSCASHRRKSEQLPKETVKPRTVEALTTVGSFAHPSSTRFLQYEELKEATNNFEHASILGEGGFGIVFKGVLSDGTQVAIKRLSSGGQQGDKEFLVEVEMLSRLHHRNLVKLVGYYSNRDNSENLLCYELVPNGSLEAWLHGPLGVNCPLDWDTRMKIALDAARGLAYLHEDSQPCVIHRDFKASNILLENNFNAKVADFGLAKQAPEGRATYLSTRVMGTFGYVAPEYAMTGHLLVKSDVYSYGVVLLELLTGRKPVDMSQPSGQENLVSWSRPILRDKERLEELADPKLGGKYPIEDLARVCTIAAACVSPEANQRPTMGEVVQSLKMVQRVTEYQDTSTTNDRAAQKQSSTTFESDGTSSIFSSGPYSGLSAFDHDNISRTALFSEDLHEGR